MHTECVLTGRGAFYAQVTYGHTLLLRGNERGRLGPIVFIPSNAQTVSDTLAVINNLTNTETVSLSGKGGMGSLSFQIDGYHVPQSYSREIDLPGIDPKWTDMLVQLNTEIR